MVAVFWTIIGLIASLVGVLLLFFFGMPYRVRTGGANVVVTEHVDRNAIRREAVHDKLGWLGVLLASLGTVAQIVGAILSAHLAH